MNYLLKEDPQLDNLIKEEAKRQDEGLEMIPSENYVSESVREAMGSILTNKYSEGYPNHRYYGGNEFYRRNRASCARTSTKVVQSPIC